MAFIRLKGRIVKDTKIFYAYLVKNRWSKKLGSPRQNVSKYLGRVYPLDEPKELAFTDYIGIDINEYAAKSSKSKIIDDLVRWEIKRHDADKEFTLSKKMILKSDKDVVLKVNEGYLCGYTIRRLHNFTTKREDPHFIGVELAERFTEAGIKIPRELFVLVFEKFATFTY